MTLREIRHELRIVQDRLVERIEEIIEEPDLPLKNFKAEIEVGTLDGNKYLRVMDFIGLLDDELSEQDSVVEIQYGVYRDDCDLPIKASFSTEVVWTDLGKAVKYENDYLVFDVAFSIEVFETTEWVDCFALTDDVYEDRMAKFEEMTKDEWDAYES